MEKLRRVICTVTNDLVYDQRMIRICTSLAEGGYDVTLVGRMLTFSPPLRERPFRQKRLKCLFKKGKLFYLEYNLRLFFFLLFRKADIIHSVDLDTLLPGFLVSRIKGSRMVYDAHEYFPEVPEVIDRPAVKKIWLALESFVLPRSKYNLTVCDSIGKIFTEKYKVPVQTIMNAPLLQKNSMEIPAEPKYVLYQGALNKGRGIEHMIEAMSSIEACEFHIAGEGDLSGELREMVRKKGLDSKVKFLGKIDPADLPAITKKAFAGLNVSENLGLSYFYSLNNKFFDYVHNFLPALTNQFPEYMRFNDEFGVCVMADANPDSLKAALGKLLNDPVLYQSLKSNCERARQQLNWQKEEQKLLRFYQSIR